MLAPGRIEAAFVQRGVPGEHVALGDQGIGVAVTGEVNEAEVGVLPIDVWKQGEGGVAIPPVGTIALVEAGCGAGKLHHVNGAIAGQVDELMTTPGGHGHRRHLRHHAGGAKAPIAQIGLVVPGAAIFAQHAGKPLAIEVQPAVARALRAHRQVGQLPGVNGVHGWIHLRLAVAKADRWQGARFVGGVATKHTLVTAVRDAAQGGVAGLVRVLDR